MVFDVRGCWVSRRIAGHNGIVVILVDANVVHTHGRGEERRNSRQVDGREAVRHAKVENNGHWLLGHHSLADVSVGTKCLAVNRPHGLITNHPGDVALCAGGVIKGVGLVSFAVVPVVV